MLYITTVMCLFYLGGKGYLDGTTFLGQTLTASTIVSFYMYIATFFNPIQNLAEQFNWLQSAFASAEKVFTIMDIKPKLTDAPDAIELDGFAARLNSATFGSVMYPANGYSRAFRSKSIRRTRLRLSVRPARAKQRFFRLSAATTSSRRAKS